MHDNKKDSEKEPIFVPSQTPTSATDYINVGVSENGSILLQLISAVPGYAYENHRTVVSADFVEAFIDGLCRLADYYPTKPAKGKARKKAAPKKDARKKS